MTRAHYLLALAEFGKGKKEEALDLARKAVSLDHNMVGITFRPGYTDPVTEEFNEV